MPKFVKVSLAEIDRQFHSVGRPNLKGFIVQGSYLEPLEATRVSLSSLFEDADPGRMYLLEFVEMSEEEYDALPEFDGF